MHSCLYQGRVLHERFRPVRHRFTYGLYMLWIDLDELALLPRCGIACDRPWALASFSERDHQAAENGTLADEIREVVQADSGVRPSGPIRLLTQLRYLGYYFSPLNLYYCFDAEDCHVETIVAEVSNTPWHETHRYVLGPGNRQPAYRHPSSDDLHFAHPKQFHVSPFMSMDGEYRWQVSPPGPAMQVGIQLIEQGYPLFTAALELRRRPLTRGQLARMFLNYPFMTARITSAIYWQAWKLWWKKCPYYSHPQTLPSVNQPAA